MELELQDVGFRSGETTLLESISCRIAPGHCVLVMGPSGAGKTLLMKIMATIVPPSSGVIRYDERNTSDLSDRELDRERLRYGFVFQDAALWQNSSVLQNLTLATQYHHPRRDPAIVRERVDLLCRRLNFREDLNQRPALLSAGERKVASIIRALMQDPETLFMDEPSGGLDSATSDRLLAMLRDLKKRGRTMVIASHDSEIASQLADDILVVEEGRLLTYAPVSELIRSENPRVREILADVFDLSSTYDADILDILGSDDDPFA